MTERARAIHRVRVRVEKIFCPGKPLGGSRRTR